MNDPTARRHRSLRPLGGLLVAGFVSVLGTSMAEIALPWFVLSTSGSITHAGFIAFAETAPYVLLQALSGPLVDRAGARGTYLAGNATAAVGLGAVPLLQLAGELGFVRLTLLVALVAAARGTADCAGNVLLPGAAERGRVPLVRAVALSAGATRMGLILGVSLAGLLIATAGATAAIAVNAAAFAVASTLTALCVPATPRRAKERQPRVGTAVRGYRSELLEGLRFLRGDRLLLGMITLIAVTNLLDQALSAVLLPAWVKTQLDDPRALGLITGAVGVGAVLGSGLGVWLSPRLPRLTTFRIGFLLVGAPRFLTLALCASIAPVLAVSLAAGMASGLINPIIGTLQYERIPRHLQARVLGAVKASAWVGMPFGGLLAGFLAEAAGLRATLVITGVLFLATTLVPFRLRSWRTPAVDRPPAERTVTAVK
ncbi:MFS transporter [Streptomyces sp. NPDC001858]